MERPPSVACPCSLASRLCLGVGTASLWLTTVGHARSTEEGCEDRELTAQDAALSKCRWLNGS